jgi:dimethylargininase
MGPIRENQGPGRRITATFRCDCWSGVTVFARHALVRRPSPRLAEGLITHIDRSDHVNVELAQRQWDGYVAALRAAGWTTHEVPAAPECPDSVFVEDTMVVYDDLAVIGRSGADERRPEIGAAEEAVRAQGYRIASIEAPGTLDGGDVLKHSGTVWVGIGGRTNAEGIAQLQAHLRPFGVNVVTVPVTKALHLKSAMTALPDGTIIGYEPVVDDPRVWGERFLAVPEEPGAAVVLLEDDMLLMSSAAPHTARLFEQRRYRVIAVDISEFEKLEGCVTCLSVRLRGRPDVRTDRAAPPARDSSSAGPR